jgi:hypothetical protein
MALDGGLTGRTVVNAITVSDVWRDQLVLDEGEPHW